MARYRIEEHINTRTTHTYTHTQLPSQHSFNARNWHEVSTRTLDVNASMCQRLSTRGTIFLVQTCPSPRTLPFLYPQRVCACSVRFLEIRRQGVGGIGKRTPKNLSFRFGDREPKRLLGVWGSRNKMGWQVHIGPPLAVCGFGVFDCLTHAWHTVSW